MKTLYWSLPVFALLMGTIFFTLLLSMGATTHGATSNAKNTPSRHALVIGNSAYKLTTPLENPARDARLIAKALENAGFKAP